MIEISTGTEIPQIPTGISPNLIKFIKQCLIRDPNLRPSAE